MSIQNSSAISEPICKMVAAIIAAHDGGVDEAMDSLVDSTGINSHHLSSSEQQLLVISAHMADLFAGSIAIIAKDRKISPEEVLNSLAISAMS